MPLFRFLLTHPSGERRHVSVSASSADEAAAFLEEREARKVAYEIGDAAELEKKLRAGELSGRDKARLLTHQQSEAYAIAKAKGA